MMIMMITIFEQVYANVFEWKKKKEKNKWTYNDENM